MLKNTLSPSKTVTGFIFEKKGQHFYLYYDENVESRRPGKEVGRNGGLC